ncbi:EAL domain-containing protein [Agrobacterium vitis]|uniref:EAL domain-containing protein n=2 Tax=Agrobacterium vitis TaxID=373 RepID=A0A109CXH3_AGRVI|nr:EAL domain-containing protein [Agrobacterium vitis]MCF1501838.1 EAL domain-containing protein [Allorhizobium sp. Av2]KAA3506415.1 EAL domain-containing protein [Agrobacterium vitis]KAA3520786.1 EAL domain-containing protein [Agrobacterium vitis]MBF2714183.1 EAL domain-containing protein [Agrobacterium vitis]MCM2443340.1 EAL domain-containing protein [Agrobacterium vitis]
MTRDSAHAIPVAVLSPLRNRPRIQKLSLVVRQWRRSLGAKITLVLLVGVIFAYGVGAMLGLTMFVSAAREQRETQAKINIQIASAALRSVYTYVSATVDANGRIARIVSSQPVGDDASVLLTGFSPVDVLASISAQTTNNAWLFSYDSQTKTFLPIASSFTGTENPENITVTGDIFSKLADDQQLTTGFASIGGTMHYVGLLPISDGAGRLMGAVATSIGRADELRRAQEALIRNSLIVFFGILCLTGFTVTSIARRLFKPFPQLVHATLRVAREDTDIVTPFQNRADEIGDLAVAIETLREAVVERARLREIRDMAIQMEHMAHHDALTGLPNRALLMKRLDDAVARCSAMQGGSNILLLDLDRFKAVNDTLGHGAGDALLIETADRIRSLIEVDDVAARLGGDEFAIIQRVRANYRPEAEALAKQLIESLSQPLAIGNQQVKIGTSIGIASMPVHGVSADQVLQNADLGLYRAKSKGRGTFAFFEEGMDMAVQGQHALAIELRTAIQKQEFELHFQPIVDFSSGATCAFEALIRWRHPKLGLVAPDRFISLAEETGSITELGNWVLQTACAEAMRWEKHIKVAVNISALQLREPDFAPDVLRMLSVSGLEPERLELEVTESLVLEDEVSIAALTALAKAGVSIVLDDFGTGYASLISLLRVPFKKLKIDRAFVSGLPHDAPSATVVAAVIALTRQLDITVTAEGVENEAQAEILRLSGCTQGQGYHFGRPSPSVVPGIHSSETRPDSRSKIS